MAFDADKHAEQVARYARDELPRYEQFAELVRELLRIACERLDIEAIIQVRPKGKASFAEKAARKWGKYEQPVKQLTDLCGGRAIVVTQSEVEALTAFLRRHLRVDEANSPDIRSRLAVGEFGYLSEHLVVQIPWATLVQAEADDDESPLSETGLLLEEALGAVRARLNKDSHDIQAAIGHRKAELQTRTLVQHAWASVAHDRLYKSQFDVPRLLERQGHRTAALLEEADDAFSRLTDTIGSFEVDYASSMPASALAEELAIYRAILALEARPAARDPKVALRFARLGVAAERWDEVIEFLVPLVEHTTAQARRLPQGRDRELGARLEHLLGIALMRSGADGREQLARATELAPHDAGMLCDLGDAHWQAVAPPEAGAPVTCPPGAAAAYERAFELDAAEPRVFRSYVEYRLCTEGAMHALATLRPALEAAVETCGRRAEVGVYLPAAYYDMGLFQLLLGRPYESLAAYAQALHLGPSSLRIDAALRTISNLQHAAGRSLVELAAGGREATCREVGRWYGWSEWVRRLLLLAGVARPLIALRQAEGQLLEAESLVTVARRDLDAAEGEQGREQAGEHLERAIRACDRAREALPAAHALVGNRGATAWLGELRSPDGPGLKQPVVILAGGCHALAEPEVHHFESMVCEAFEGFSGTLVSGGTDAGVSGVAIRAARSAAGAALIAYALPGQRSALRPEYVVGGCREITHAGEVVVHAGTMEFSALEPLQTWTEILLAGVPPWEVRVLGVNGGDIAAFEYRLALALGARVGVLESSGRAVSELRAEAHRWGAGDLLWIPDDRMSVRAFLQRPLADSLTPAQLEIAAKAVHERYLAVHADPSVDPARRPWEDLAPGLQDSNRQQVLSAAAVLATERFGLRERTGDGVTEFTAAQIERMAEREHGRWVVERLGKGWARGEQRDADRKLSPFLVGWSELTKEVKAYDAQAIRDLPIVLAKAGLEIYEL